MIILSCLVGCGDPVRSQEIVWGLILVRIFIPIQRISFAKEVAIVEVEASWLLYAFASNVWGSLPRHITPLLFSWTSDEEETKKREPYYLLMRFCTARGPEDGIHSCERLGSGSRAKFGRLKEACHAAVCSYFFSMV